MKTKQQAKQQISIRTRKRTEDIHESTEVEKPMVHEKRSEEKALAGGSIVTDKAGITTKNPIVVISVPTREMQTTELQFIKKELVRSRNVYKVTFQLPGAVAPKARKVTIVGEFNNWDRQATPLKKMANGDFVVTLELDAGKEYRFRYLIDGNRWENDWHADKYVKGPYGDDDSVVCVSPV